MFDRLSKTLLHKICLFRIKYNLVNIIYIFHYINKNSSAKRLAKEQDIQVSTSTVLVSETEDITKLNIEFDINNL